MNKYLFLVFKNMDTVMTCNTNIFSTILSNLAINNRLQNPKKNSIKFHKYGEIFIKLQFFHF